MMQNLLFNHSWNPKKPGLDLSFLEQEFWFGEAEPVKDSEQGEVEEPDTVFRRPSWLKKNPRSE